MIAAGATGLVMILALACAWLAGRVRLRRSLQGDGELASRELVRALRALGYALPATVTLAQVERLVALHGGPAAARYVTLLRECRYGPASEMPATLRQRSRLRRGITSHLGPLARIKGLWALPPGCAFAPRCPRAQPLCSERRPDLLDVKAGHRAACWFPGDQGAEP